MEGDECYKVLKALYKSALKHSSCITYEFSLKCKSERFSFVPLVLNETFTESKESFSELKF